MTNKLMQIDFMFQLTDKEWKNQRSQFVTFKNDTRKYKPYVFTEQLNNLIEKPPKTKRIGFNAD